MSIFDSGEFEVDGVEVAPEDVEGTGDAPRDFISWAVVDRWCREHPCRIRLFSNVHTQVTTYLRKRYPHLTPRATNYRRIGGRMRCDLLVTFIPEGEQSPFAVDIPGIALQHQGEAERRDTAARSR